MKTEYGIIPDEVIITSLKRLIGKVFKILPMREEGCETLDEYINSLLRELVGQQDLIYSLRHHDELQSLINTLRSARDNDNYDEFRSDILKSLGIIKGMIKWIER